MMKLVILIIFYSCVINILRADKSIVIQSTSSLKNSGFYNYILPDIYKDLGIKVNVVAVGSGAAIRNSMNCDGDLLIVHSPNQEKKFILEGYASKSNYLMHNFFVIIGPKSDPIKIKRFTKVENAFKKIFEKKQYFISRGDNSGTHSKEMMFWKKIKIQPSTFSGEWYLETGTNMGATINTAVGLNAYTLTDKASWISFNNKQNFEIIIQENNSLINNYNMLVVKKTKCPLAKQDESQKVVNWLKSTKAKQKIINFKRHEQQLFFIK